MLWSDTFQAVVRIMLQSDTSWFRRTNHAPVRFISSRDTNYSPVRHTLVSWNISCSGQINFKPWYQSCSSQTHLGLVEQIMLRSDLFQAVVQIMLRSDTSWSRGTNHVLVRHIPSSDTNHVPVRHFFVSWNKSCSGQIHFKPWCSSQTHLGLMEQMMLRSDPFYTRGTNHILVGQILKRITLWSRIFCTRVNSSVIVRQLLQMWNTSRSKDAL